MTEENEELNKELGTTRRRVLNLLARDERFRNSDRKLYFAILKESWDSTNISEEFEAVAGFDGMFLEALYKLLEVSPDKSSVKRVRAQIQNQDEMYPATDPDVIRKRQQRDKQFREYYAPKGKDVKDDNGEWF